MLVVATNTINKQKYVKEGDGLEDTRSSFP